MNKQIYNIMEGKIWYSSTLKEKSDTLVIKRKV